MGYKHTFDTIYTHFQCITNNIYGFGRLLFAELVGKGVYSINTLSYQLCE